MEGVSQNLIVDIGMYICVVFLISTFIVYISERIKLDGYDGIDCSIKYMCIIMLGSAFIGMLTFISVLIFTP